MKVKLDNGAYAPTRAHETDAGLDLYATHTETILPLYSVVFDTGVHVELPHNTCGMLVSKSGLNTAHSITSTGLIDEGYEGSIRVKLYNHGDKPYTVSRGDKITQLVILPVIYEPIEIVDDLPHDPDGRGTDGFGSTGK